eukprot:15485617-Alexandrium_andersonii.AAC.2
MSTLRAKASHAASKGEYEQALVEFWEDQGQKPMDLVLGPLVSARGKISRDSLIRMVPLLSKLVALESFGVILGSKFESA